MNTMTKMAIAGGLMVGTLWLAGCASTGTASTEPQTHAAVDGMMCPGCQTVWVTERTTDGPRINRLQSKSRMTCDTCNATAEKVLLGDGTVQLHNCPGCKVTPTIVKSTGHPAPFLPKKGPQPRG